MLVIYITFVLNFWLDFKYEKDSVMVVNEEEYENCKSTRPLFFGNNGDTVFKFERPGLFYFISGVSGHCTRGQKMIIKVLDIEPEQITAPSPQSANENAPIAHSKAAQLTPMAINITTFTLFALSFLGMIYAWSTNSWSVNLGLIHECGLILGLFILLCS